MRPLHQTDVLSGQFTAVVAVGEKLEIYSDTMQCLDRQKYWCVFGRCCKRRTFQTVVAVGNLVKGNESYKNTNNESCYGDCGDG